MGFLQAILFGAGYRIKDVTGKRLKLYDQFQQVRGEPPIPPAVFDCIRTECNNYDLTHSQRGLQAFFVIFGIWQIGSVIVNTGTSTTSIRNSVIGVLFALACWTAAWGYAKFVRASPAAYCNELLAHAHCPSCGYPLSATPSSTTTCSECGACWRSEKIGRPIPIAQPDADA